MMKQSFIFWVLAFIITVASAYYQRVTGPTHAQSGKVLLSNKLISYKLQRSHGGESNCPVMINTGDPSIRGSLEWRLYETDDEWTRIAMVYHEGVLSAELPYQPPAGKLEYRVLLFSANEYAVLPQQGAVVIRFKGDVPLGVLIPHVLAMFGAMLLSARAGLEYFNRNPNLKQLIYWTLGFLFVGGMILGPIVQHYAFDVYWTGWPFGTDLTDNKTLVALLGWIVATVAVKHSGKPAAWALAAAILLLLAYMIPHSLVGSELDSRRTDQQRPIVERISK